MQFTSYGFLAFLAVLFLIYYGLPRRWQWGVLLLGSYVFYAFAGLDCLVFILLTTLSAYGVSRWMGRSFRIESEYLALHREEMDKETRKKYRGQKKKQRFYILVAGLVFSFGILAVLKYTGFAVHNLSSLMKLFGGEGLNVPTLLLPMGISFYIFQTCGYLIDVYRGKTEIERNPFRLALFVSFFPQLVQGPISRHSDLSAELFRPHEFDGKEIGAGLWRVLWGFFKKLVIADRVLIPVKGLIEEPSTYTGAYVALLILLYSIQIYADFTGGIDMTIGIAQMFGIRLKENFNRPFSSHSTKEYWNRWHITMGTWFTDYIFYPLSVCKPMMKLSKWSRKTLGAQVGKRIPVYLATVATWFLTGLWHGAGWNFIVWGLLNCLVILVSQELEPLYLGFRTKFPRLHGSRGWGWWMAIRTFLLMGLIRSLDCYRDVGVTFRLWGSMVTDWNWGKMFSDCFGGTWLSVADWVVIALGCVLCFTVSSLSAKGSVRERLWKRPVISAALFCLLLCAVLIFGIYGIGYDASEFIYKQF